jgi:hypothetical protein
MTTPAPFGPGQFGSAQLPRSAEPLQAHERSRIRAAARHARRIYPGELGELVFRELTAYAEFGIRFSTDSLIPRLATRVLATRAEDGTEPTTVTSRPPLLLSGRPHAEAS